MTDTYRREIALVGTMCDLPAITSFVAEACAEAGVAPEARFDLELAVEEACCNVMEHAYGGAPGELRVTFEAQGCDVVITVCDRGRPFDPNTVPPPDMSLPLEERPIGGLGLFLMRQLMDTVQFTFTGTENRLRMVKRGVRTARRDAASASATAPAQVPGPGEANDQPAPSDDPA
jgi:anti-sigma regulatory factor (Ser/Thr protein kinase)